MFRLKRIFQLGFSGTLSCLHRKIYYYFLSLRYGFDPWHATAPFECRPYKAEVIRLADRVRVTSVLEIGCGLGDIISRIDADRRVGVDIDESVVFTAQKLYGSHCKFVVADLSDVENIRKQCEEGVDLLVMVNWPHLFPWFKLSEHIRNIIDQIGVRYLIIDGINSSVQGYAYYHGAECYEEFGEIVHAISSSDGARVIYLVRIDESSQVNDHN